MPLSEDKTTISIYVERDVRDRVKEIADEEERTISEQMKKIFKDWVKENKKN